MAITVAQLLIQIEADNRGAVQAMQQTNQLLEGMTKILEVIANRTSAMTAIMEQAFGTARSQAAELKTSLDTVSTASEGITVAVRRAAAAAADNAKAQELLARSQRDVAQASVATAQALLAEERAKEAAARAASAAAQAQLASARAAAQAANQAAQGQVLLSQATLNTARAQNQQAQAANQQAQANLAGARAATQAAQQQTQAAQATLAYQRAQLAAAQTVTQTSQQQVAASRAALNAQNQALAAQRTQTAAQQTALAQTRAHSAALNLQAAAHRASAAAAQAHTSVLSSLSSSLQQGTNLALRLATAFLELEAVKGIIHGIEDAVVGLNAKLELAQNTFANMLRGMGSDGKLNDFNVGLDRAKVLMGEINEMMRKTTFSAQELNQTVGQLLKGGIPAKDVMQITQDIKNIASVMRGLGEEGDQAMSRLSYAIAKIGQTGHVTGQEIRQLYNDGVNIPQLFEVIAEQTGKTVVQVEAMGKKGEITSAIFLKAFHEWATTRFGDQAEAQLHTFTGALQNLRNNLELLSATAFKPLFDRISQFVQKLAEIARSEEFQRWAIKLAAIIDVILTNLGGLVEGFKNAFLSIANIVLTIGQTIHSLLSWINPMARHSPSLVEDVEEGVARIEAAYQKLGRDIPDSVRPAADAIQRFHELTDAFLNKETESKAMEHLGQAGPGAAAAYQTAHEAIQQLRADAEALTPEIATWKEQVDGLKAAHDDWRVSIREVDDAIKDFERDLEPLRNEIRANQVEQLQWKAAIADVDLRIAEAERGLKPYKDAVKDAGDAVRDLDIQLRQIDAQLKASDVTMTPYKVQMEALKLQLSELENTVGKAKDAYSNLNEEMQRNKNLMNELIAKPFAGEREVDEQILSQRGRVEAINARLLEAKSRGAKTQAESIQKDLEKAQAQLQLLESKKNVNFNLPREQLKALADQRDDVGGTFQQRKDEITNLASQNRTLQPAVDAARDQVDAAEALVRNKKDEILAVQKILDTNKENNGELLAQKAQLQAQLDLAKNTEDQAKLSLESEERKLDPLKQEKADYEDILHGLEAQGNALKAQLELQNVTLDDLKTEKALREEMAAEVQTQLDAAKTTYDDLVTAQKSLVAEATNWEAELKRVVEAANSAAAAAKRGGGAGAGAGEGFGGDITAGFDQDPAVLEFQGKLKAIQDELEKDKADAQAFFDELGTNIHTFVVAAGTDFENFGTWLHDNVHVSLEDVKSYIEDPVLPTLGKFKDYLTDTLIPDGLQTLKDFLDKDVHSAWEQFVNYLNKEVTTALNDINHKINPDTTGKLGELEAELNGPMNQAWKDGIGADGQDSNGIKGFGQALLNLVGVTAERFKSDMGSLIAWINEHPKPMFESIATTTGLIKDILLEIVAIDLHRWFDQITDPAGRVQGILAGIKNVLLGEGQGKGLVELFGDLWANISNDWAGRFTAMTSTLQEHVIIPLQNLLAALKALDTVVPHLPDPFSPLPPRGATAAADAGFTSAPEGHAAGGMINEPIFGVGASGKTYTFGEKGPEIIAPVVRGGMGFTPDPIPGGLDVDTLARAMAQAINGLSVEMDGEHVGRIVAKKIGNNLGQLASVGGI